eukprot:scaffold2262_cov262-Pinguiococcus_pyrenoidosus.AAC.7
MQPMSRTGKDEDKEKDEAYRKVRCASPSPSAMVLAARTSVRHPGHDHRCQRLHGLRVHQGGLLDHTRQRSRRSARAGRVRRRCLSLSWCTRALEVAGGPS